jgi:hypothetical protein
MGFGFGSGIQPIPIPIKPEKTGYHLKRYADRLNQSPIYREGPWLMGPE